MKKRIRLLTFCTALFTYITCCFFCNIHLVAQTPNVFTQPHSLSNNPTNDVLQWQIDHSLLAKACDASAGVITTNVEGECLKEEKLIASTNGTHQTAEGYTLHYLLWDVTSPNFPSLIAINTTGVFDAPLRTRTYQIYAYSEQTADAPIPSPVSQHNTPITAIGADYAGCFQFVSTQPFRILGTFRLESVSDVEGDNVQFYEFCGGQLPYKYELSTSEGSVFIDQSIGSSVHCRKFRLVYGLESTWEFTVYDSGDCDNAFSFSSAESLFPIIKSFEVTHESCPDEANGSISVFVQGGIKCDFPYTYSWTSTNGYTGEGMTITNLSVGEYTVVVTDCAGNTTSEKVKVKRDNGVSDGRSSRRGCRGHADKMALNNTAIEWIEVYPNPIAQQAFVEFMLDQTTMIEGRILNFNGQEIAHFYSGKAEAGILQRIPLSVENLPSGMYFLQLQGDAGWQYLEKIQVVK